MPSLRSVSPDPTSDKEVAVQGYATNVRGSASLTQNQIDSQVSAALAPYASKSYVDSRDALNATKAQVDAGDSGKLKKATININNGVAGLDSAGRVPVARVPGSSTQRWPKGYYTPSSYGTGSATGTTEVTLFTHTIANPGYTFRPLVAGQLDVRTNTDGDAPVVRVRVGSTSGPVVAIATASSSQYRYGVDTFNRIAPSLGAGWEQVYTGTGSGHTETTTKAFWVPDGNDGARQGVFRKIADFSTTADDYQEVYYKVADAIEAGGVLGSPPHNRLYGRMNTLRTSYVAFDMTDTQASLIYATGGAETTLVAPTNGFAQAVNDEILAQFGYYAATNKRRFRLLRNGTVFIDYTDAGSVTPMGTDNRGWGFGHRAGSSLLFGQPKPAALDWIALTDPVSSWSADPENASPAVLMPTDLSSMATLVGDQTLYITLSATTSATVTATNVQPKLHVMAIPA